MKIQFTLALLLSLIAAFTFAQNVPNGSFENWTDNEPDDWGTSNIPGSDVITQSPVAFSGSFAARGKSIEVNSDHLPVSLEADGPPGTLGLGFPITEQFTKMKVHYKFDNGNNDELVAVVSIRNTDSISIGLGGVLIEDNSEDWSLAIVPIEYTGTGTAGFAAVQFVLQDNGGDPPSTDAFFIIDDVELTMTLGIDKNPITEITVYPNPTTDVANIAAEVKIEQVSILNTLGQEVYQEQLDQKSAQIDLSDLQQRIYFVRMEANSKTTTRKILVK